MSQSHQLVCLVNDETSAAIQQAQIQTGAPVNEVIRRSVSVYTFMREQHLAGKKICIENPETGEKEEFILI